MTDTLDPIVLAIMAELDAGKPGASISPEQVARAVAEQKRTPKDTKDLWRKYLSAVKQQGIHLARAGRIELLRKGKPVDDPAHVKGVVRYRLLAGAMSAIVKVDGAADKETIS
jgi:hypothetical protein